MNDPKVQILSKFPEFKKSDEFAEKLIDQGQMMTIEGGTTLLNVGDYIKVIPFLINGLIKIYREDEKGNEILLYYINSGESCVISITASLKNEQSSIKAFVEEDSTVLAVPIKDFTDLLSQFDLLHSFTYDLFNLKYNELIKSIDSLAFTDIRTRLYKYLVNEAEVKETQKISGLTHKKIAHDLSTSREVVSRLLSALQKEGKLSIQNKEITINN